MFKDFGRRLERDIKRLVDTRIAASESLSGGTHKAQEARRAAHRPPAPLRRRQRGPTVWCLCRLVCPCASPSCVLSGAADNKQDKDSIRVATDQMKRTALWAATLCSV